MSEVWLVAGLIGWSGLVAWVSWGVGFDRGLVERAWDDTYERFVLYVPRGLARRGRHEALVCEAGNEMGR